MRELSKPAQRTYWVARDDDGTVIHTGHTDPDQVTTTGLNTLVAGTKENQVRELEKYVGKRPLGNYEFDSAGRKWKKVDEDDSFNEENQGALR